MAWISTSDESFSPWRRVVIAAEVMVSTLAVLALAVMVNYLAQHYGPRFYWGASNTYRLSALTLGALEALTNRVRITVFFDRDHPVYPSVRALLQEYSAASPRLKVDYLDYTRHPAAAQDFRRRFPMSVTADDADMILFESGSRTKVVPARDLRDYDQRALLRGDSEALPVAFKGEMMFTSAINAVCEARHRRVYFLQGHLEHDFQDEMRPMGYGQLAGLLAEDNIEISGLSLEGGTEIPHDCELLIVAGLVDSLTRAERQAIEAYLRRGGRLFVLFRSVLFQSIGYNARPPTGLEPLLAEWGVSARESLVLDEQNRDQSGFLIVSRFGNHPVTRALGGARLYLLQPREIEVQRSANSLGAPARSEVLLRTGTNGIAVTTFMTGDYRITPEDRRGEISLAVAVERGSLPGVAANLGTTRIVAVGDSSFLANQFIQVAGNRHFATSAINWLLDRSYLLAGIPPAPIRTYQVSMTPFQQRMLRMLLLGVLPGSALCFGFLVWWRRH
jgi:hypothetical protein